MVRRNSYSVVEGRLSCSTKGLLAYYGRVINVRAELDARQKYVMKNKTAL